MHKRLDDALVGDADIGGSLLDEVQVGSLEVDADLLFFREVVLYKQLYVSRRRSRPISVRIKSDTALIIYVVTTIGAKSFNFAKRVIVA